MAEIVAALLGFGNVGRAFCRYVLRQRAGRDRQITIRAVCDSSGVVTVDGESQLENVLAHKESGRGIREFSTGSATTDANRFIQSLNELGVSVLIESLPTNIDSGQPALELIESALVHGTSVVTVDKGPVVHGLDKLLAAAKAGGSRLAFTGTTGVRVPDEIGDARVIEFRGVLNGTTNYILTEMQERATPFDDALRQAQGNGIAEPDPRLDVEGWDTACKILILAKSLMGADARLSDVSRIGIGPETESLIEVGRSTGRVVRLIGRARIWQGRVRVSVAPKLVGPDSPFYGVTGTSKAALIRTEGKGEFLSLGDSGRDAIAGTIETDIGLVE
ncbi:MAG TPA: hypothetical protein VJH03_19510 [Blastocatellia bacterium]|nr:hypothetical protein [Blastocatellia bacterium]